MKGDNSAFSGAIHRLHVFPTDLTVELCREAIRGVREFREIVKDDYIIFLYDFFISDRTFPDPNEAKSAAESVLYRVRRECRGIVFGRDSGELLSRRFHKFFNVNELNETNQNLIDISRGHYLTEKMDGCLITPIFLGGRLRWASKSGITNLSERLELSFIDKNRHYCEFSWYWISRKYTPLFEYSGHKNSVVFYENEQLVLTGIRENYGGIYLSYEEIFSSASEFGIPVVRKVVDIQYASVKELVERVRERRDIEGCVLVFDSGEMYKIKSQWYLDRIARMSELQKSGRNFWYLIADRKVDDYLELLNSKRSARLAEVNAMFWTLLGQSARNLQLQIENFKGLKKNFSLYLAKNVSDKWMGIYWEVFNGEDALQVLRKYFKNSLSNRRKLNEFSGRWLDKYPISFDI